MKTIKFLEIAQQTPYLTKQNLQLPLGLTDSALDYWIKKMISEEQIISIKKGMYISKNYLDLVSQIPGQKEVYFEYLASISLQPSYISLEYVLSKYSIIPEAVFAITAVTPKTTRSYQVGNITRFYYQTLKKELYWGSVIKKFKNFNYQIATPAKALIDYLYLKPLGDKTQMSYFLLEQSRINWIQVKEVCPNFIQLIKKTTSRKLNLIKEILQQGDIL